MREESNGKFWLLALLAIPLSIVVGIVWWFNIPHNESDWFGGRYIAAMGVCLIGGSLVATLFSIVSLIRKERVGCVSILPLLAGLGYLLFVGNILFQGWSSERDRIARIKEGAREKERLAELIRQNPSVAITEEWHKEKYDSTNRHAVLANALEKSIVSYPEDIIEKIYPEILTNSMRTAVLKSSSCTEKFLMNFSGNFGVKEEVEKTGKYYLHAGQVETLITDSPNVPRWFLEEAASSKRGIGLAQGKAIARLLLDTKAPALILGDLGKSSRHLANDKIAMCIYTLKKENNRMPGDLVYKSRDNFAEVITISNRAAPAHMPNHTVSRRRIDAAEMFNTAINGILFIEEIGATDLRTQETLLRELNERGVWKIAPGYQLIATSTQNLAELAAQGMFNAELYEHLRKQTYKLPSWWEEHPDTTSHES